MTGTVAQTHLHPNKRHSCVFGLYVPIAYRIACGIPPFTVAALADSFPSGSCHMNPNCEHRSFFPGVQTQRWLHTGPGAAGFPCQPFTTMTISPNNQTPPLWGWVAFCVAVPNIPSDWEWAASFFQKQSECPDNQEEREGSSSD